MPTDNYDSLDRAALTKLVMRRAEILCEEQPEKNLRDTIRVLDSDSLIAARLATEAARPTAPPLRDLPEGKVNLTKRGQK
jgi:hypothetical protein